MDKNNISKLQQDYGLKKTASVELLMKYHSTLGGGEVQDPYYEDELVFETVIELTRDAAEGLLNHIREQHQI
jgi:protein-tyrosine-phosphatase